jgi:hypothetical protein
MADNGALYRVVRAEQVRARLRDWAGLAKQAGILGEYVQALKRIEHLLTNEPLEWGDPLYHMPQLGIFLYRGMHWFFVVHYAVHEKKHIVFVKDYKLTPENPLEPKE